MLIIRHSFEDNTLTSLKLRCPTRFPDLTSLKMSLLSRMGLDKRF